MGGDLGLDGIESGGPHAPTPHRPSRAGFIENEGDAMEHNIDTYNRQLVGMQGDMIVVAMPQTRMTKAEALVHAAWIVALADDDDTFPEVLAIVQES